MPTICIFDGIKISMFYRDHAPPHFHAEYADEAATIGNWHAPIRLYLTLRR